jgi:uncharacterized phage-associated protein
MPTVFDVAKYILKKKGPTTTVKLQKLVYYCQAWSLVWDEKCLFKNKIQAWASGPVIPTLFHAHKGKFIVNVKHFPQGSMGQLSKNEKETIDSVIEYYGDKPAQWLVDLTHLEDPWRDARKGWEAGERCSNEITPGAMIEYYSGL